MSETSATPPSTAPKPTPNAANVSAEKFAQVALERAPEDVRQARESIRVRGEVRDVKADGRARIDTPRGEVEVRVPPDARTELRSGDRVEITIPPRDERAHPQDQREVQIRVTERKSPERTDGQVQADTRAADIQTRLDQAALRVTATPVDVDVNEPPPPPSLRDIVLAPPLQPGTEVRLQPLPPALVPQVQPLPVLQIVQAALPALPALSAALPADVFTLQVSFDFLQTRPAPSLPPVVAAGPETVSMLKGGATPVFGGGPPPAPAFHLIAPPDIAASAGEIVSAPPGASASPAVIAPDNPAVSVLASRVSLGHEVPAPLPSTVISDAPLLRPALILGPDYQVVSGISQAGVSAFPDTLNVRVAQISPPPAEFFTPRGERSDIRSALLSDIGGDSARVQNPRLLIQQDIQGLSARVSGVVQHSLPVLTLGSAFSPGDLSVITPENSFILHSPLAQNLNSGTEVQFTVQTAGSAPAFAAPPPLLPLLPVSMLTPGVWPALQEIQQSLIQNAPHLARAVNAVTPNPASPAQIMPAALFFIAAFKGGDLQSWLGEKAVESLRQSGKGGLLQRLSQEGGLLNRLSSEPVSQDWRALALPMAWENEIHKIAVYFKHDDGEAGGDAEGRKGTRFLMDFSLSRMGKIQLDGLVREKKLDMILRTEEPFSQAARVVMRGLYSSALEAEDLAGELSFQNRPEQWVKISAGTDQFRTDI